MKISIVIPTYNGGKYIEETILSVINQTRQADEIIISDDNSSDNTIEICEKYKEKVIIYKNNNGPSGFVNGWNRAIRYASYDYISILHQDDLLEPTFIEEIEKAVIKNPDVMHFFTPCKYIDEHSNILKEPEGCTGYSIKMSGKEYANRYVFTYEHVHRCPGVVTHKSIFNKCQYRESAGHIADDDFFLRVGNFTDIVGIFKPLSCYRIHSNSETGHLSQLELCYRLLVDHNTIIPELKKNPIITQAIIRHFCKFRKIYEHRVIIYSMKLRRFNYTFNGLKYMVKRWIHG